MMALATEVEIKKLVGCPEAWVTAANRAASEVIIGSKNLPWL
jgi:hypothetical protein